MRIDWATLCKGFEDTAQGQNLMGVNQDTVLVTGSLPANVQVLVAVCIAARYDELGSPEVHHLRVSVDNPSGEVIAVAEGDFQAMGPAPGHYAGWEGRMVLPVLLQITVTEEGPCVVTVDLDNSGEPTTLPYFVQTVPEP